jgi:hypothetical protein
MNRSKSVNTEVQASFRCAVQDDEIRSTMGKLFNVHEEITRDAKQQDLPVPKTADLPRLWIITPTMSKKKNA